MTDWADFKTTKVQKYNFGDQVLSVSEDGIIQSKEIKLNKYSREIKPGVCVDVYDVLNAFETGCSASDHAIKKLLAAGERGHKDRLTDLQEAKASIERAIEQHKEWNNAE